MVVMLFGRTMPVRPEQLLNAKLPILVRVLGKEMEVKDVQYEKALSGKTVMPSGTVTLKSFVHPANIDEPAVVQPVGMLMLLKFVQFWNA